MKTTESAIIIGVGSPNGIGGVTALKAASEGMHVFIAGRTREKLDYLVDKIHATGGSATAVVTDSTRAEDIANLFAVEASHDTRLKLLIYNTGRNIPSPFMDHDTRLVKDHWERCVYGSMIAAQHGIKQMLTNTDCEHKGSILFTGASAAMRGLPLFSGFSAAKAGARAMSQAMVEEFTPQGIHICHMVIDGIIDGDLVKSVGGLGSLLIKSKGPEGALIPEEIAKTYWAVHQQKPNEWSHEIDLRPFKETF